MSGKHLALIVEDDSATADDLAEILNSLACDVRIASNKQDALASLYSNEFCLILLDLEIRGEPDSIRGHTEHGNSLLREIRQLRAEHTGVCYWLPIVIVSGFAHEVSAAVEVMKDGANDVVHKPFIAREVSGTIRRVLELSGRATHDRCSEKPGPRAPDARQRVVIAIPGDRERRRTRVMVSGRPIWLTNSCLKLLLRLMVAREDGGSVHKRDLGANDDQGFKGVSILREALKPALADGVDVIGNDHHGFYHLKENVVITGCDTDRLTTIGDAQIAKLGQELRRRLDARGNKSEGNS